MSLSNLAKCFAHHLPQFIKSLFLALALGSFMPIAAAQSSSTDPWEIDWTIYGWGAWIKGETATGDDIDLSLGDIVKDLKFAFFTNAEARKGPWSLGADIVYLNINPSDSSTGNLVGIPIEVDIDIDLKTWVINLTGGYAVLETDQYRLDVLAGARFLYMDVDLDFRLNKRKIPYSESGGNWNGIVGVKGKSELSDKWYFNYYADIGTGQNKFTWQAAAGFGYRFKNVDAVFGYRHSHWDWDEDDDGGDTFDNLYATGPYAGVKFRF